MENHLTIRVLQPSGHWPQGDRCRLALSDRALPTTLTSLTLTTKASSQSSFWACT
ncbi:hypothetical protein BaRGS_00017523, partial [Batillaria attramentaria]